MQNSSALIQNASDLMQTFFSTISINTAAQQQKIVSRSVEHAGT